MNFPSTGSTRSTPPFTQGPRGRGVGWSGVYLFKACSRLIHHAYLTIFDHFLCCIVHAGPEKTSSKKLLCLSWWVSCASDRICFRRDCGTTIRFHLRFTPSKIVNSSFMRLYGLRSCPLPIIPYVSHGKRALFFSLSCQRSKEEQKK